MRVPLPVCCAVLTSARNSGCRYSSVCLATLACSLFQAPDPERPSKRAVGVFGRDPCARVLPDSGESSACPSEIANAEALGENSPALACRERDLAYACCHSSSGSHGGGWISPRLI